MNYSSTRVFRIPKEYTNPHTRINYVLTVCQKLYADALFWRNKGQSIERKFEQQEERIKRLEEENKEFRDITKKLEKELKEAKTQIEEMSKTNHRYKISLFDSGNMKSQAGPDTTVEKKQKGGQHGHQDTNRESRIHYDPPRETVRVYATNCTSCTHPLTRTFGVEEKVLIDFVLNQSLVHQLLDRERQWCSNCRKPVVACDTRSLPFSEYGINIFMVTLILRYRSHLSLQKIADLYALIFGLEVSKSTVHNLLTQAKKYLKKVYAELIKAVKHSEVTYNDETGWKVRGKSAWLWVSASEDTIVYKAAESRGKGIAKELIEGQSGIALTDGYAAYDEAISAQNRAYCWAHLLRFAFEETIHSPPDSKAIQLRSDLVGIYHQINQRDRYTREDFYNLVYAQLLTLLSQDEDHEDRSYAAIRLRIKKQAAGLSLSLSYTPNGTNNRAEQSLRPMAILRNISYGSDTYTGMETTAINASVVQTFTQQAKETASSRLVLALQSGAQSYLLQRRYERLVVGKS